ncbi:MAG: hypothetical protein IPK99_10020 [Flavobacteriales bacterium]|nr:hypothetical protein [Flavobacteriales bacterium]
MNALHHLSSADLRMLLGCERQDVLGRILELNHSARYHNLLNAVELANLVEELLKAAAHDQDGSASLDNDRRL